jgi:hypothetical protein
MNTRATLKSQHSFPGAAGKAGGSPLGACLRPLLSRRLLTLLCIVVAVQALRLFVSLGDPAREMQAGPRTRTGRSQTPSTYEDTDHLDRIFYSTSRKAQRDCGGSAGPSSAAVTVITLVGKSGREDHPGYLNFLRSLDANGYDRLVVLEPAEGLQEIRQLKRTNYSAEADFWAQRLKRFVAAAQASPPDAFLLFCDALDVYFTQPPDVLIQRFKGMNKSVVFAAEVLCDTVSCRTDFTLRDFLAESAPPDNAYRFLNAGMFMGRAGDVLQVLSCALRHSTGGRDDQTAFTLCYRLDRGGGGGGGIGLDHDSLLFGNIPPARALFDDSWASYSVPAKAGRGRATLLHRTHLPRAVRPVALHFLGMSFRRDLPFVPCQQFLRSKYNELGDMIHLDDFQLDDLKEGDGHALISPAVPPAVDVVVMSSALLSFEGLLDAVQGWGQGQGHGQQQWGQGQGPSHCLTRDTAGGRLVALLGGLRELVASVASALPPAQSLGRTPGAGAGAVSAVYVYVQVNISDAIAATAKASRMVGLGVGDVVKLYEGVTACVASELQRVASAKVLLQTKVVFHDALSSALAGRGKHARLAAFEPLPEHGFGWVWSSVPAPAWPAPAPLLLSLSGRHAYGEGVLGALLRAHQQAPRGGAAFGFSGLLLDEVPSSGASPAQAYQSPRAGGAAYLRSAGHWADAPRAVDLLSSDGAVLYDMAHFVDMYMSMSMSIKRDREAGRRTMAEAVSYAPAPDDACLAPHGLDALLGGHLAGRGVPRVQLPAALGHSTHATDLLRPGAPRLGQGQGGGQGAGGVGVNSSARCDALLTNESLLHLPVSVPTSTSGSRALGGAAQPLQYAASHEAKGARDARRNVLLCQGGRELVNLVQKSWRKNIKNTDNLLPRSIPSHLRTGGATEPAPDAETGARAGVGVGVGAGVSAPPPGDRAELRFCPRWLRGAAAFSPLPPVPLLHGFSWKQNWVSGSATSPCTCHLFTRAVTGQPFLGQGQYLGQGQHISSSGGEFWLRLDSDARLCIHRAGAAVGAPPGKCLSAPPEAIAAAATAATAGAAAATTAAAAGAGGGAGGSEPPATKYYVALLDGSVCFFEGSTPYFGGSAADSGHRRLVWCSVNERTFDNTPRSRQLTATGSTGGGSSGGNVNATGKAAPRVAFGGKVAALMKNICGKLYVGPAAWTHMLLVAAEDGAIELRTSHSCASSRQLCSPSQRLQQTTMLRCF